MGQKSAGLSIVKTENNGEDKAEIVYNHENNKNNHKKRKSLYKKMTKSIKKKIKKSKENEKESETIKRQGK